MKTQNQTLKGLSLKVGLILFTGLSLVACGTGNPVATPSPAAPGSTAYNFPTTTSSSTPAAGRYVPAGNPLQFQFKINGTGNLGSGTSADATEPPYDGIQSNGPVQTFGGRDGIRTDRRLRVDIIPSASSSSIYTFNDFNYRNTPTGTGCRLSGGCYSSSPKTTACLKLTVELYPHGSSTPTRTETVIMRADSGDGSGRCPNVNGTSVGQVPTPSIDWSNAVSGGGSWDIKVSNFSYMYCINYSGGLGCFQTGTSFWFTPMVSQIAQGTIYVNTSDTN